MFTKIHGFINKASTFRQVPITLAFNILPNHLVPSLQIFLAFLVGAPPHGTQSSVSVLLLILLSW